MQHDRADLTEYADSASGIEEARSEGSDVIIHCSGLARSNATDCFYHVVQKFSARYLHITSKSRKVAAALKNSTIGPGKPLAFGHRRSIFTTNYVKAPWLLAFSLTNAPGCRVEASLP